MNSFRGSGAGYCSRQIVTSILHPDLTRMPEGKRPFLDAGHYLQEAVEAFILEHLHRPLLRKELRESEGVIDTEDFLITGHVDGIFADGSLLEVKAVKHKGYEKIRKSQDWREPYGHYRYQAQIYQQMFGAPGTHFVYYNRDTSDMMGSLGINHPAWTFRADMWEPRDDKLILKLLEKYAACSLAVTAKEIPLGCDAEGYCYFCAQVGSTPKNIRKPRRVSVEGCDTDHNSIQYAVDDVAAAKDEVLWWFKYYKADEIGLEDDDVILRKEDYT